MKAVSNKRKRGMQMFFCLCCSICNCFLRDGCGPNKQKLQLSIQTLDEVFLSSFSPLTDLTRHLKATVPGFLFCFFIARLFYLFCLFFGGFFVCLFVFYVYWNKLKLYIMFRQLFNKLWCSSIVTPTPHTYEDIYPVKLVLSCPAGLWGLWATRCHCICLL